MRTKAIGLAVTSLVAVLGVEAGTAEPCYRVTRPPSTFEDQALVPGEYRVVFVATRGPRKRKSMEGRLILKPTSPDDTSPVTGQRVKDPYVSDTSLYGWLEADLGAVAAPICSEAPHPLPGSTDPVSPGVLVRLVDWEKGYPENTPVLTVATLANLRGDRGGEGGCGIGMWVREMDGRRFAGDWDAWGILHGGRGHFCAYPVEEAESIRVGMASNPALPPPAPYDLLQIEHLGPKGRVQDQEFQRQGSVIQAILRSGKAAIPGLIDLIESDRPYPRSPIDFWPEVREGDVALAVLSDLFLDSTWRQSTLPELCWDSLLERTDSAVPAWELLDRYVRAHGRASLASRWRAAWSEHEAKIVWDDDGRFFKVADREPMPCRLTQD